MYISCIVILNNMETLIPSKQQTKEWRKTQEWYINGKHSECEKYQILILLDSIQTHIISTKILNIHAVWVVFIFLIENILRGFINMECGSEKLNQLEK